MLFSLVRRCAACIVLCAWSAGAAAASQAAEPGGELSLAAALQAALARHPELAAAEYALKIGDARITQAGLRPNPELSLELEDFAGSGSVSGVRALQTTLSLSQVIELGGQRRLRLGAAASERGLAALERQAQQLDVLAETTRRYVALVAAQEKQKLAQRAVSVNEALLEAIDARVQAARSPEAERSRARIALTRAQIEQQHAAADIEGARRALAAQWGSASPRFTQATGELFTLPETGDFTALSARLAGNPDFLRFAGESRLREAELRLAQAQARPNLNLSLGVRRLEASDDMALVGGFSLPLRGSQRNQGAIREAELRRELTEALRQAAQIKAEATLFGLHQELESNRRRVSLLRSQALPQAQAALEQTRYGYERGRFSYLELAAAQQELLEIEAAAIDAAADAHRMLIEIERLTGEALHQESG